MASCSQIDEQPVRDVKEVGVRGGARVKAITILVLFALLVVTERTALGQSASAPAPSSLTPRHTPFMRLCSALGSQGEPS
jgi:hypothetical protein